MLECDVLVVGGGVQGLWLANDLTRRGFSVTLLTDRALGFGQTLHSHLLLHRGYLYSDLELIKQIRESERMFRFFVDEHMAEPPNRVTMYVMNRAEELRRRQTWAAADLRWAPCKLPAVFAGGEAGHATAMATGEMWLDGEELMAALAAPVAGRLVRAAGARFEPQSGAVVATSNGIELAFAADYVVLAAGAGNAALAHAALRGGSGRGAPVPQQLRRSQMMVVRNAELPDIAFVHPELSLFSVAKRWDGEVVWLVSFGSDETYEGDPAGDDPPVDRARLGAGVNALARVVPSLGSSEVEWGWYTGLKSELRQRDRPGALPSGLAVETVEEGRILAVWPTKLTLAPLAATRVAEVLQEWGAEPRRGQPDLGEYERPEPGREKWLDVEWSPASHIGTLTL